MTLQINPEVELKVRLAVLIKLSDPTGRATETATYRDLAVTVANFMMEPANHARYLKISQDVSKELSLARPSTEGIPSGLIAETA